MITGLAAVATSGSISDVAETSVKKALHIVTASASDGATYTATVDGMTALEAGVIIVIKPSMTATSTTPTLNVNGLGAIQIRRKMSSGTLTRPALMYANVLYKDVPLEIMYDGTYWVAVQFTKPSATDLYGNVPVQNGGWYINSNTTDDDKAEALEAVKEIGVATTATYTASVTTTWTADSTNGGYYQTVSVSGILATDNPIADIVLGSNVTTNKTYKEAWALVDRITTAANSITLYANEKAPTVAFTVQLKVVR